MGRERIPPRFDLAQAIKKCGPISNIFLLLRIEYTLAVEYCGCEMSVSTNYDDEINLNVAIDIFAIIYLDSILT